MNFHGVGLSKRAFFTLRHLKWATIILPVLFLAGLDWVRHTLFFMPLHTLTGFIVTYVALGTAVAFFSFFVFGVIERLEQQSNERNRQLQALNDIALVSAAKPELNHVLDSGLDAVLSSMKIESGLICLVDSVQEEHSAVCSRGVPSELMRRIQHAKIKDDPIAQEVVRTGSAVIIERVLEDPRVAEAAKRAGIKSMLSAPLKSEGEVNGILAIATNMERHFSKADREFLEGIGGQLGMAIRNATLYEESQRRNNELEALLAMGRTATGSFDLNEVLERSLDTIIEVTPVDAAEIWLLDGESELTMRCHRGGHYEAFCEQNRYRIGDGIPGIVARSQESILSHNVPEDDRFQRQGVVRAGFLTVCVLPLTYQQKPVGVLLVASQSADAVKGPRELRLLDGIGEWLAVSIENTRLYQQVQDVAVLQERERLAREMHDGMAQLLGYINTQTLAVKKLLADNLQPKALEELVKMEEISRDLYADVREGILGLRTKAIRDDGLFPVLRQYAGRYTDMTGISVQFDIADTVECSRLSPHIEIQLLRIIQESLTNVRKHAKANAANVAFARNDSELLVTIADNGQGFNSTRLPATGRPRFGLQTMRERAEALGGSLVIEATPERGTRIEVRIPLTVAK